MDRGTFLKLVGLGYLASSLPVVFVTFFLEEHQSVNANPADWEPVGKYSDLKSSGQLLNKSAIIGPVLIVLDKHRENIVAVNPICTHKGCTVGWDKRNNYFVCPCHNSCFGIDGKVKEGPAKEPLKTYSAKVEGDYVVVLGV